MSGTKGRQKYEDLFPICLMIASSFITLIFGCRQGYHTEAEVRRSAWFRYN